MKYLVDTNIFLEILLSDNRMTECESFVSEHRGDLYISDFSLNSIGIILYRLKKIEIFETFLHDILPHIDVAHLIEFSYEEIVEAIKEKALDFDDAYQLITAKEYDLTIATMDGDFKKVQSEHPIIIL